MPGPGAQGGGNSSPWPCPLIPYLCLYHLALAWNGGEPCREPAVWSHSAHHGEASVQRQLQLEDPSQENIVLGGYQIISQVRQKAPINYRH